MALRRSSTELMSSEISPFFSMSTTWGRPSCTLLTGVTGMPASAMAPAVPLVATSEKPISCRVFATRMARGRSICLTEMKAVPSVGMRTPPPTCDLMKAEPNE